MSPQEPSTNSLSAVDLSYAQFNDTNYSPDTKPSEPVTETCFKRSDPEIKLSEECTAPFDRKLIVLTAPEQTTPCAPPEHSFAHLVAKNLAQLASRASESTSIVMVCRLSCCTSSEAD